MSMARPGRGPAGRPTVRNADEEIARLHREREALERRVSELERSQRAFRALVEATSDAVFVIDLDLTVRSWNDGCERLFGWGAAAAIGLPAPFVPDTQRTRLRVALRRIASLDAVQDTEFLAERADGSRFGAHLQAVPLNDAQGASFGVLAIVRSVDADSRVEQMQDDFIALVSQELRNPLTSIVGFVQLLSRPEVLEDQSKRTRTLKALEVRSAQMIALVDDLLIASRIEKGELRLDREPVDLAGLVTDTVMRFEQFQPEHRFVIDVDTRIPRTELDVRRISQALTCLLSNAVKYSPDGGRIRVGVVESAGRGVISVADRGLGLPGDELDRVFDRFYKVPATGASASGAGLGLYLVKVIAEAHGGDVAVTSKPGRGSTFTLRLPLSLS
ncbi:MAG: ATP-binding protein [Coriobacteriia bacterium]|nr:ATP-binding protein [Coriobacteriia bacterium]